MNPVSLVMSRERDAEQRGGEDRLKDADAKTYRASLYQKRAEPGPGVSGSAYPQRGAPCEDASAVLVGLASGPQSPAAQAERTGDDAQQPFKPVYTRLKQGPGSQRQPPPNP